MMNALGVQAQNVADTSLKATLLQRSKNQKSTGWIFLGLGGATFIGGVIIQATEGSRPSDAVVDLTGSAVAVVGALVMVGSLSFFHSAKKNKRKAMAITLDTEQIMIPEKMGSYTHYQPVLSLKIPIGFR